ncbi:hypothetical protein GCM10023096_43010 [Nonomuraea ferruginea]
MSGVASAGKPHRPVRDPDWRDQARSGPRPGFRLTASTHPASLQAHTPRNEMIAMREYAADEHRDEAAEALQTALDRRDNGGAPQNSSR